MKLRPSPALLIALLALVIAVSAGTSYAAAKKITSKQIKDNTVQSKDVKDSTLTGADVADGGLGAADLAGNSVNGGKVADGSITGADVQDGSLSAADLPARTCAATTVRVLDVCIDKTATGPGTFTAALADCDSRGGRLMGWAEFKALVTKPGVVWADGTNTKYEYLNVPAPTGQYYAPSAVNNNGPGYYDQINAETSSAYFHRCVLQP